MGNKCIFITNFITVLVAWLWMFSTDACHIYATSMTSVRLSVTLLDCDHIVQQKVEMGP